MTIIELINELSEFAPDTNVRCQSNSDKCTSFEIEGVEECIIDGEVIIKIT